MYQGQKKLKEALLHYQEALGYAESSKGEKSLECVPLLRELAGVEQALGLHEAAISHLLQVSCHIPLPMPDQMRRGLNSERAWLRGLLCISGTPARSGHPTKILLLNGQRVSECRTLVPC